ncbi:MAG: flagellar export chaperone FliS [Phycisphaerae bacterium]
MSTTLAHNEYLKNAVLTAPPEQLQLMLIDGAIRFATRGRESIEQHNFEASFNALERAQKIVLELQAGLKRDVHPRLVDQMNSLYMFIWRRLVDANMTREVGAVDDALRILRHQRETWLLLMEKLRDERAATAIAASPPTGVAAAGVTPVIPITQGPVQLAPTASKSSSIYLEG